MDEYVINVKQLVNTYWSVIFKIGLIVVILANLFLFTNLTTDIYEFPKFAVLLVFTGLLLVMLTLKFTLLGKVILVRTPLDIPLLLLLAVAIFSTFFAPSLYVALFGNQLRMHGSLVGLVVYILFYFVLVNNLKSLKEIKWLVKVAVIASQVLAVLTLLSYAGVKFLPAPWTQGLNFTPTGSSFSTTAILSLLIPIIVMEILTTTKSINILLNALFLFLSGVTIALTGSWATWIAGLAGLGLTLLATTPLGKLGRIGSTRLISLLGPIILIALITVLSFVPPIGSAKNPLYTQAQNFPREVQLDFISSWKISVSAFRDSPVWGSGLSSYLFDFTSYKPVEFNSSKFWNLRFDSSFNEYLQTLSTLGGIGLLAMISLTALFVSTAYQTYKSHKPDTEKLALGIAGICFFIILLLHTGTLPLWITGLFIISACMVLNLTDRSQTSWGGDLKSILVKLAAIQESSEETIKIDALPGVLLVISLGLILFSFFFGGKFLLADYHHRQALTAVAQNDGIKAYNELITSEKLNPYTDFYRTDLAQVNFALANAIAVAKGPSEASPAGSLTAEDQQNIQTLLQQSIAEARTATTLNPRSAINWEVLALLYRQIAGVAQNALVFSLDAYGRAILQDPLNPQLRLNVGGVYYAIQNYDLAIRFFTDAINLKPDFANGYYNLSVALRDKGDLANAQAVAEKLITLIKEDSPDYQPANDYLTDLKNRIASGSAKESNIKPPAAETTGALQKKELPKVVNVGNPPEKIATPEAVKKPEPTPTPNP